MIYLYIIYIVCISHLYMSYNLYIIHIVIVIIVISPLQFSVKVAPPDSVSTKLGPDPQTGVPITTKSKVPDLSKHGYHYKIKTEHVFLHSS